MHRLFVAIFPPLLVFLGISAFSHIVLAQGDYAPFEQEEKLNKILNKKSGSENSPIKKRASKAKSSASAKVKGKKKSSRASSEQSDSEKNESPTGEAKSAEVKSSSATSGKVKDPGQNATVKVDGSAVYEEANFDAPVMEYLDQGKKFKISRKIYPGIGGLGAFYKIRLRKGVYGYITDIDVTPSDKKTQANSHAKYDDEMDDAGDGDDPTRLSEDYGRDPDEIIGNSLYFSSFLGISYYSFNYAQKVNGRVESAPVSLFGVKKTGAGSFMGGMPLDLNLVFTTTAPDFYSDISNSTSGFLILADALAVLPFYESKRVLLFYGFGVVTRYEKWSVKLKKQGTRPAIDSQEVGLGAAAEVGLGALITRSLALRVDAKYYYENQKYFGLGAALQFKF